MRCPLLFFMLGGFLAAGHLSARAQETLFNVPSSDVLDKGKVYGELDATFRPFQPHFSSFVPRMVVGSGGNIEVGLNLEGNRQPGSDTTILVPSFKWKPYQSEHWSFVAGDNVFIPVRNRSYDAGNYLYAQFSRSWKTGTRLTFGGYDFSPGVVAGNQKAGGQFGFEHPLNRIITIAADWYTGNHNLGYFTPGFFIKPASKITLYTGYSIGNHRVDKGNHYFLVEAGYNF